MSDSFEKTITPDDLMEEFISDSIVADDELSDSIFTCLDNYIDDMCIDSIANENCGIFDDNMPFCFTYTLDKVEEKIDDKIEELEKKDVLSILGKDEYNIDIENERSDSVNDKIDPGTALYNNINYFCYDVDYCDGIDDDIDPEDFQLYISKVDDSESTEDSYYHRMDYEYDNVFDDANFNA